MFGESFEDLIGKWARPTTLFAFDFDGTLSPIVDDPGKAHLPRANFDLLEPISRVAPVAVISGRSLADLREQTRGLSCSLVGNHGIESSHRSPANFPRLHAMCQEWQECLLRGNAVSGNPGIILENKGCSLSLHYRSAAYPEIACLQLEALAARLKPTPRIVAGKFVINLLPPGCPDKGEALLDLIRSTGSESAIYVGDDETDEDVFSLEDERILSVRVEPSEVSRARYFLEDQAEITRLLRSVLSALTGTAKAPVARRPS